MIKPIIAAALALAPHSTATSDALPPLRYQQNMAAVMVTVHPSMLAEACNVKVPPGYTLMACSFEDQGTPVIIMPNPCLFADGDYYARILCHESGHVNGWPATHGD